MKNRHTKVVACVVALFLLTSTPALAQDYTLTLDLPQGCPGRITISWSGAGLGMQALVKGDRIGRTTIPPGFPCAGTVLGIQGLMQVVDPPGYFSTEGGSGSITGNARDHNCGWFLQLVKGGSCATSNVVLVQ